MRWELPDGLMIGVHQALRNTVRTPVRSLLIILSIAVAISLYALLTEIGNSFHQQMLSIVKSGHVDVVVMSRFSATPLSSRIVPEQIQSIRNDASVSACTSVVMGKIRSPKGSVIYMIGIADFWQMAQKLDLNLIAGRPYRDTQNEAVMASRLLRVKGLHIGESFPAPNGIKLTIVGSYVSWLALLNNTIVTSDRTLQKILGRGGKTNMLFLSLHDPTRSDELIARIHADHPDLRAIPSRDLAGHIGVLSSLAKLLDLIAAISLMIAIVILMSTFVMAIYQRMRQIGILSAIGWPKGMIMFLFVIESIFLALLGGIIGLMLSSLILMVLRADYPDIAFYLPETLSLHVIMMSLLMSLIVGAIAAVFPAYSAVRRPIVEAIRDE